MGFLKRIFQKDEQKELEDRIGILLEKLHSDDPEIRKSAMENLEVLGMEQEIATLKEILMETEEDEFRYYVITGMARIGMQQVVEAFIDMLDYEDVDVRFFAIKGLGMIGTEQAEMGLMEAQMHEDAEVDTVPISALEDGGIELAVEGLISALDDDDAANRKAAIMGLGEIGTERALNGLIQALDDNDPGNRGNAIAGLGNIGTERAVEQLIIALNDENTENRECAISWLEGIGTERAVQGLVMALNDDDDEIRDIAQRMLSDKGTETENRMKEAIDSMIVSGDAQERKNGLYCLEYFDTGEYEIKLIEALADPDDGVRMFAIENLLGIETEQVEIGLMKAVHSDDPDILGSIIQVFDRLGADQTAVEQAIELLYSEDVIIGRKGIRSLQEVYAAQISEIRMKELIGKLSDENRIRREMAVHSLGELGNGKAIPYLEEHLNDRTRSRLGYYGSRTFGELARETIKKLREDGC